MYCFIPELIELCGVDQPVNLGGHAILRRLQSHEAAQLRTLLDPYIHARQTRGLTPWEFNQVKIAPGQIRLEPHQDTSENIFWVVEYREETAEFDFELALELAEPSLTPLLKVSRLNGLGFFSINHHAIINWLDINYMADRVVMGEREISEIIEIRRLLIEFSGGFHAKWKYISQALKDFAGVKEVSLKNPLYVVGLVSIIETLLVTNHSQKAETSLTHQFKEKLALLNNRFAQPMDLKKHFPNAVQSDLKKILGRMYSYRSDVAHGNDLISSKSLDNLGNHKAVCNFLHELVRKLLVQALKEPELVADLKSC